MEPLNRSALTLALTMRSCTAYSDESTYYCPCLVNSQWPTVRFNSDVLQTDKVISDDLVIETIGVSEIELSANKP